MERTGGTLLKNVLLLFILSAAIFGIGYLLDSSSLERGPSILTKHPSVEKRVKLDTPNFAFQTLQGQSLTLKSFRGKVVILNFWASWCGPCQEEFPEMYLIANKYDNVRLVAISGDESKQDILKFLVKLKKNHPALTDKNVFIAHDKAKDISSRFNVVRLPETFIIDKNHQIVQKVIGSEQWVNRQMRQVIESLL